MGKMHGKCIASEGDHVKKPTYTGKERLKFAEGKDGGGGPPDGPHGRSSNARGGSPRNVFMEIAHSLMEKNSRRVLRYYCANPSCRVTFFDASGGYACPYCGAFGIISEYRNDTGRQEISGRPILGCLDSIGRLFCSSCAERLDLFDNAGMLVFPDSMPYAERRCEACRRRLDAKD